MPRRRDVRHAGRADQAWRRSLLAWSCSPAPERGIQFARAGEEWEPWSYERLARAAFGAAWGLVQAGVGPNQVVSIVHRPGPDFVTTLVGTMLAGAIPSPLAPPLAFHDGAAYADHVRSILTSARPALMVADAELTTGMADLTGSGPGPPIVTAGWLRGLAGDRAAPPDRAAADLALLQFTSGSSGTARGVRVPFAALEANIGAIHQWLRWSGEDISVSWLPLHHDMGLVGCLLGSLVAGTNLRLLRPEQFVRRPLRFLQCLGRLDGTMAASPPFGLEYVLRHVRPEQLDGCDFSRWRILLVGAERIDPGILVRFHELLAPFGFRSGTLLPAYGLAEATLAVTGLAPGERWRDLAVEPGSLAPGREARLVPERAGHAVVGCGGPLAGTAVTIVGPDGNPVGERRVGEIVVTGPALAAGYVQQDATGSLTRFASDGLRTGDAGFLAGGQLYVLGRLGDSLKIRGRTVFAEQLEAVLVGAGAPSDRLVVLLGAHRGEPLAVVLLERPAAAWSTAGARLVGSRAEGVRVAVVELPGGGIARTSSGKPRRRLLWRAFVEGTLPGTVVESTPAGAGQMSTIAPSDKLVGRGESTHCSTERGRGPGPDKDDHSRVGSQSW